MLHVGDITMLHGADLPPVDIVTGDSPCQDLSVAGKHAGLAGERSGLFMEQIRIIKEMRNADEERQRTARTADPFRVHPRYMLWENVPGVFSSNGGEDFRSVLEEIVRIKDHTCTVPRPDSGVWQPAGAIILGDEFSLAWRILDAQYWGVPQRRKRIFLVADFGGSSAPKILFEQDRLFRDTPEGKSQGQGTAVTIERSPDDTSGTCLTPWDVQSRRIFEETGTWPALYGGGGGGHGYIQTEKKTTAAPTANQHDEVRDLHDASEVLSAQPGIKQQTFIVGTEKICSFHLDQRDEVINLHGISGALLTARNMQTQSFVAQEPLLCLNDQGGERMDITEKVSPTLRAGMGGHPPLVAQPNCLNGWDTQRHKVFTAEGAATPLAGADGGGQTKKNPNVLTAGVYRNVNVGIRRNNQPVLFENHGIDSRYTGPHKVSLTMSARMGKGGNNVPLVNTPLAYSLDTKESNSMKSSNPYSGCRETVTARTIDTQIPDPSKNQGGIAILQDIFCIAGNIIDRTPKNGGNGLGCQANISYTLTGADRHAVFSRQRTDVFRDNDAVSTQSARQHKDATDLVYQPYQKTVGTIGYSDHKGINNQFVSEDKCIVEPKNLIRRLTPLECERLQGFPAGWTKLENASDSARYKALGNSVAIPCVSFVMRGIAFF